MGPTLRGAAMRRTLQEGPKLCCGLAVSPGKPRPPTHPARGEFWSCHGSGRFGDTTQGGTKARSSPLRGEFRVQTWMSGVVSRAHQKVASHLFHRPCHHTACSTTPMQNRTMTRTTITNHFQKMINPTNLSRLKDKIAPKQAKLLPNHAKSGITPSGPIQ